MGECVNKRQHIFRWEIKMMLPFRKPMTDSFTTFTVVHISRIFLKSCFIPYCFVFLLFAFILVPFYFYFFTLFCIVLW